MVMSYLKREDIPYHYALADAFTVGDAYFCSIMGPTNPNRIYLWAGPGGTDGLGVGPATYNGLSVNNAYRVFPTFPGPPLQDKTAGHGVEGGKDEYGCFACETKDHVEQKKNHEKYDGQNDFQSHSAQ
jgi:hypothetical protein